MKKLFLRLRCSLIHFLRVILHNILLKKYYFAPAKKAGMDFHELLDIPQGDRRRYHDDVSVIIISFEGRIWRSSITTFFCRDCDTKGLFVGAYQTKAPDAILSIQDAYPNSC
ncbi:hypothetical protein F0562_016725 [Nyssa sinensis]|uniref:Protein-serine/threonine phosphatase n=1 Tax=Nyssa sinensis TaxID=561372 RepID=A0A5J4ZFJ3_9ASTE|nr:hypothetical protein F0562_016725 [Nyssa sinensis]